MLKSGDTTLNGALMLSATTGNPNTIANGGLTVTGTTVTNGTTSTVVATPGNQVLIPQQGDLSMGTFVAGALPQQPTAPQQ
jgi:hypothetical protein